MTTLDHCKRVDYHTSVLFVDEKATLQEMKAACPLFFKNKNKGETHKVYRGCLIVNYRQDFTGAPRTPVWHLYAFDVRRGDMMSISSSANAISDIVDCKEVIDDFLSQESKFTLGEEVMEITVPAKVKVTVVRDETGRIMRTEVTEWLHVGTDDPRYFDPEKPDDAFTRDVWIQVSKQAK